MNHLRNIKPAFDSTKKTFATHNSMPFRRFCILNTFLSQTLLGVVMKHALLFLFLLFTAAANGQLTVVSTIPVNNAKNVPLTSQLSITFSAAIDTALFKNKAEEWGFSTIDSASNFSFSADAKTVSVTMHLRASSSYFLALVYVKAKDGAALSSPFVMYFTTASTFPPYSVSGTVYPGNTGVSPQNSIVGLSKTSINEQEPVFVGWTNVNSDGSFSVPNLANGVYWPIAAKDANNDGSIDPSNGIDVVAFGDSVVVNNASVTNYNLTFKTFKPYYFSEAFPIADSLAKKLPADRALKSVQGYRGDSLGRFSEWEFIYLYNNNTKAEGINVSSFDSKFDQITDWGYLFSLQQKQTLANPQLAVSSGIVLNNVESGGGKSFRQQPLPDSMKLRIDAALGDLNYSNYWRLNPTPGVFYWGVTYSIGVEKPQQWFEYKLRQFLCNFSTGAVISSITVGVQKENDRIPISLALQQNFPNPFNPVTTISFSIPQNLSGFNTTLTIYDGLGREIQTIVNETKEAGVYSVQWNGEHYSSGLYFAVLRCGTFSQTIKMQLLK